MILVIGGRGQGKLDYVLAHTGLTLDDVAHTPEEAAGKRIFSNLARWLRDHPESDPVPLLAAAPDLIVLCDEVGCGVVPVDAGERAWRELVGRTCGTLAASADAVIRVYCGLGMALKGDLPWN